MREAIVLAGGLGTRLAAAVPDRPKALAPIAGRPFLAWQLDYLRSRGVGRVVLSIGHLGDQILGAFGTSFEGLDIAYVREREPLGTGGAVRKALCAIEGRGAFVANGDTMVVLDFDALEGRADESLVVSAGQVDDASRFGTLALEGGRLAGFREKSASGLGWVNAGVYWVARDLLENRGLPDRFSFEADFLARVASELRPRVVAAEGPIIDIGIPAAWADAQRSVPALVHASAHDP